MSGLLLLYLRHFFSTVKAIDNFFSHALVNVNGMDLFGDVTCYEVCEIYSASGFRRSWYSLGRVELTRFKMYLFRTLWERCQRNDAEQEARLFGDHVI